ncbi:hypothetical protein FRX31_018732 [Thalictrum thalictroides]|uniref:Reverse transcriptase zinc-binding domain n=1 Tax=Thalictrum thalictroides TaxID=46969 RepID=A0A7J6W3B6_THATH|nr:hypothetical protein FRX31_018732 [Thalictrum thalictroides]
MFIAAGSECGNAGTSQEAECRGIHAAVTKGIRLQLKNVVIESDNKGAIEYLQGKPSNLSWTASIILDQAKHLSCSFNSVIFSFCYRSGNSSAHIIASQRMRIHGSGCGPKKNLVHKGFDISSLCPLCNLLPESTVHLFLHCPLMLELWTNLLSSDEQILVKVYEADSVVDLFRNWPVKSGNDLMVRVWRYLPYATAWVAWKHRNNKVFNNVVPEVRKMILEIKALAWYWCGIWGGRKGYSFRDLVVNWEGVLAGAVTARVAATGIG